MLGWFGADRRYVIPCPGVVALTRLVLFLLFAQGIYAQEIHQEPTVEQIAAAIAQIETGAHWDGRKGKAGEVGRWQILPAVLRERGASSSGNYRDFERVYSYFRTHTKSWQEACAAYHRGLGGTHKKAAKDYAQRVEALIFSN